MTLEKHRSRLEVAIVGAGPGGLVAARILQLADIPVTVYDSDPSIDARTQGGTLDLHADAGQIAIADAGLTERFFELARPEGQAHRLLDPDGTVVAEQHPQPGETAAPEIDRGQLRQMLADSLMPGTIRWGRRVREVQTHQLRFTDDSTATADVIIGADGAWSRVRAALSDAAPQYLGVTFVEALFTDVRRRHPAIAALVGDGHMWANGDGKTIVLQRNSGDVVRGYISFRAELDWLAAAGLGPADGHGGILDDNGTTPTDTERVRSALRERFAEFAPDLLRVIDESEGSLPNRPIFALPSPFIWEHHVGMTLLGDAAHLMSPFGGNGVNLALLDGAELAHAIIEAVHADADIDEALRRYERSMTARGAEYAEAANAAIIEHYAAGGPDAASIPDFDAEAERWRRNAEAYRAQRQ